MISKNDKQPGFTIIEVLIVMAIAALILIMIFIAIPQLQKSARNRQRNNDAYTILSAIRDCMTNNRNIADRCNTPEEIHLVTTDLGIYTGAHYGTSWPVAHTPYLPTMEEPNWLFATKCNATGDSFLTGQPLPTFAVFFFVEGKGGDSIYDNHSRCISNETNG